VELGQADQDERQERSAVPLVVEQDVKMVERVLVEEVRLVEEKDGMDAVLGQLLDVGRDRVEDCRRRGRGREPERDAELAVEVAPAERGVVAVGQAEAGMRDAMRSSPAFCVIHRRGCRRETLLTSVTRHREAA
jgi:hypothetical protein